MTQKKFERMTTTKTTNPLDKTMMKLSSSASSAPALTLLLLSCLALLFDVTMIRTTQMMKAAHVNTASILGRRCPFTAVAAFTVVPNSSCIARSCSPLQKAAAYTKYTKDLLSSFDHRNHRHLLTSSHAISTTNKSSLSSTASTPSGTDVVSTTITDVGEQSRDYSTLQLRLFPEELNVLYDSKCNVCKLEIDWLARRDSRMNNPPKLRMTDLESPNFDPNDDANGGIDYKTGMAAIYGIKYDGTVLRGIPVFQVAYEQVGLGWLWKISQVPAARKVLDAGYELFAKYRTRITRRSSLDELVRLHEERKRVSDCDVCQTKD